MPKDVILTPEGLQKLKDELEDLCRSSRREVAERIKEAREFGDISENSEYDDAKNEQAMLEQRITQLRSACAPRRSSTPRTCHTDAVGVGSVVNVKDDKTGKSLQVHDRRLGRGQPGGEQALQRVPGRQGADGPQARRRGQRRAADGKKRKLKITKIDIGL